MGEVGHGLISGVLMCNAYSTANINGNNHTQIPGNIIPASLYLMYVAFLFSVSSPSNDNTNFPSDLDHCSEPINRSRSANSRMPEEEGRSNKGWSGKTVGSRMAEDENQWILEEN